jgi:hypothetical protein
VDYPHYDKMMRMLQFLSRVEKEVREQYPEDAYLYLTFYHRDQPARLVVQETQRDVADALQMSGAEALSLLRELSADDYIDLGYDRDGPNASVGTVAVVFRQKGRAAIMEVPDPNAELARRSEAIAVAIEGLHGVDPAERERGAAAARELKTFGRTLAPQAALELAKHLPTLLGFGG